MINRHIEGDKCEGLPQECPQRRYIGPSDFTRSTIKPAMRTLSAIEVDVRRLLPFASAASPGPDASCHGT